MGKFDPLNRTGGMSDVERGDTGQAQACRNLWAECLLQMWLDSFKSGSGVGPESKGRDHAAAVRWFGSADFGTVAVMAGVDPRATYERWLAFQRDFERGGCPHRWWQLNFGRAGLDSRIQGRTSFVR